MSSTIPQISATDFNAPKYTLKGQRLYVLLIHDDRPSLVTDDKYKTSHSRIDSDLLQIRKTLQDKFPRKCDMKEICINDGKTVSDFRLELKTVADSIKPEGTGALLCVFLGFGESEYIYLGCKKEKIQYQETADIHETMEFAEVVKYFNGENCKALVAKPKMFIVQAETKAPAKPADGYFAGTDGASWEKSVRIPIHADIFVYFSSALAGKLWNEVPVADVDEKMSRFVQLLCLEIRNLKAGVDIQKMVIGMNSGIHKAKFQRDIKPSGDADLLPLATSQLTKDLFLDDLNLPVEKSA